MTISLLFSWMQRIALSEVQAEKTVLNASYKIFIIESLTHKYMFYNQNFLI